MPRQDISNTDFSDGVRWGHYLKGAVPSLPVDSFNNDEIEDSMIREHKSRTR